MKLTASEKSSRAKALAHAKDAARLAEIKRQNADRQRRYRERLASKPKPTIEK